MTGGGAQGQVKLTLDMAIGETSAIESTDKGKMSEISQKVRDLNGRLQDIRREQVFQRASLLYVMLLVVKRLVLIDECRSEKPSSEINRRVRMLGL